MTLNDLIAHIEHKRVNVKHLLRYSDRFLPEDEIGYWQGASDTLDGLLAWIYYERKKEEK